MFELAIVGAGPYGLSIASHAEKEGINYMVFGYPMDFWKSKMPSEMFIRTALDYTGLSDPNNEYTLKQYQFEKKLVLSYPIRRSVLIDYGMWFIEKTNLAIERALITDISLKDGIFNLKTENNEIFSAKKVVIAVGLTNAHYIPPVFSTISEDFISHTSQHTSFEKFENKHVVVVGGGQSAWEAAALLHQANATVDLAYRRSQRISPPEKNMNAEQQKLADKFFFFSEKEKESIRRLFDQPTVSDFLVPLVEGNVTERPNTFITKVSMTSDHRVSITFNDQADIIADHIITATGYRFSMNKLPFLQSIIHEIEPCNVGEPLINEHFESTVPNLYFAGPATAFCHGPTFRFIAGVWRTSEVIVNSLKKMN